MTKGLVVPDNPSPDLDHVAIMRISNDPEWIGIVRGLLLEACFGYWWNKDTGDWESARDTACEIGTSMAVINFCDEVAECVRLNDGVRGAIKDLILQVTIGNPTTPIGGGNPKLDGCNPDVIYGAVCSIVDTVNTYIVDALEIIEVASNPIESIERWTRGIPIVGAVLGLLPDVVNAIQENITENYLAQWTLSKRDEYCCDLFCLWYTSPNCELTPTMVMNYFGGKVGGIATDWETVAEALFFYVSGIWVGDQIPDIMFFLAMACVVADDAIGFFDIASLYSFDTMVAVGVDQPSNDWELLCEECPPPVGDWCRKWLGGFGFMPAWDTYETLGAVGTYDAVNDWLIGAFVTNASMIAQWTIEVDEPVTSIRLIHDYSVTRSTGADGIRIYRNDVLLADWNISGVGVGTQDERLDGEWDAGTYRIYQASGVGSSPSTAYSRLKLIEFNGEEVNPFGTDNCEEE